MFARPLQPQIPQLLTSSACRDEYFGLRVRLKEDPAQARNIPVNSTVGPSGQRCLPVHVPARQSHVGGQLSARACTQLSRIALRKHEQLLGSRLQQVEQSQRSLWPVLC